MGLANLCRCLQEFDWQQMMKSPVANWHFVKWLAQRYDGERLAASANAWQACIFFQGPAKQMQRPAFLGSLEKSSPALVH